MTAHKTPSPHDPAQDIPAPPSDADNAVLDDTAEDSPRSAEEQQRLAQENRQATSPDHAKR